MASRVRKKTPTICPLPERIHLSESELRDYEALVSSACNLDRRIVIVCCPELERVRPVIVRGSTAPPAQVYR